MCILVLIHVFHFIEVLSAYNIQSVKYTMLYCSPDGAGILAHTYVGISGSDTHTCRPGLAAEQRHSHKLSRQYAHRRPGSRLVPLVAKIGGRWHPSVPQLVRRWALGLVIGKYPRYAWLHPECGR